MLASQERCAVREPIGAWIAGGAIVAGVAIAGLLLVFGLETVLGITGVPTVVWFMVGLLPLYILWRKSAGRPGLEARQIALVVVAGIALDAALDAVLWAAKAALFAAAVVLVLAARRRTVADSRP